MPLAWNFDNQVITYRAEGAALQLEDLLLAPLADAVS